MSSGRWALRGARRIFFSLLFVFVGSRTAAVFGSFLPSFGQSLLPSALDPFESDTFGKENLPSPSKPLASSNADHAKSTHSSAAPSAFPLSNKIPSPSMTDKRQDRKDSESPVAATAASVNVPSSKSFGGNAAASANPFRSQPQEAEKRKKAAAAPQPDDLMGATPQSSGDSRSSNAIPKKQRATADPVVNKVEKVKQAITPLLLGKIRNLFQAADDFCAKLAHFKTDLKSIEIDLSEGGGM